MGKKRLGSKKPLDFDEMLEKPDFLNTPDVKKYIPKPENVQAKAPNINEKNKDSIDLDILRRTKVRELRRMGYTDPKQISMVLDKGVAYKGARIVQVDTDIETIKDDLRYLVQEDIAGDRSYIEKRVVLLDRLYFLYQRAFTDYINSKGKTKSTFLNTSFSILKSIIEMEGVFQPAGSGSSGVLIDSQNAEAAVSEIDKLSDDQRKQLTTAVKDILRNSGE